MKNLNKLKQTVKVRLEPHRTNSRDHSQSELFELFSKIYDEFENEGYTPMEISSVIREELLSRKI